MSSGFRPGSPAVAALAVLDSRYIPGAAANLPGAELTGLTLATTIASPVAVIDGVMYGRGAIGVSNTNDIYTLGGDGTTWTRINTCGATGAIIGISKLADAEVMVFTSGGAYKSSGWATNPATATFALKLTPSPAAGGDPASAIVPFGFDVWANLVLVTEYVNPKTNSKYVYLSTDNGATFSIVRDKAALYPNPADQATIHWHGVAIDPWSGGAHPRLWASHGDGPRAVFYSDDLGGTWTTFLTTEQPTTITATPAGMVFGTDIAPDGVFRVLRTADPTKMVYEPMRFMRYSSVVAGSGLYGNAEMGWRDPATNLVYVSFPSQTAGTPSVIFATDGITATIIYEGPTTATSVDYRIDAAFIRNGLLYAAMSQTVAGTPYLGSNGIVRRGTGRRILSGADAGYGDRNSVGIGNLVVASIFSAILGSEAAGGHRSVAIGERSVALDDGVTIGYRASSTALNTTVVGSQAAASVGSGGVAVGRLASCGHQNAVALGQNTATTAIDQVAVGARGVEASVIAAEPAAPAAGASRRYALDPGTGKVQERVRFHSGATHILAEEGAPRRQWGTGAPEGAVVGGIGDIYQRVDGSAGATVYVKESGTGNTGWIAYGPQVGPVPFPYKAGAGVTTITDADPIFTSPPVNGVVATLYDTTAGQTRLAVRANGSWFYTEATA